MRKLLAAAAALTLFAAMPSFAARYPTSAPATTNNADSCDLGNYPAATLLLPYFEVDVRAPQQRTVLFSITNTSPQPQIAKVTLWTDYGYPVLNFNLFLTGYDVQALNLADVLVSGVIASPSGTSNAQPAGPLSSGNTANPHFAPNVATACGPGLLPGRIPPGLLTDIRNALTSGTATSCGTARIGSTHRTTIADPPSTIAIGYATIDVVATCSAKLPTEEAYWNELLYDNVLAGDYQQIAPTGEGGFRSDATGNPLVHIRAIPSGGAAGESVATNLPLTFYGRLTPRTGVRTRDRRQPLPSVFAARFVESSGSSNGDYLTTLKIWRDGVTGSGASCTSYVTNRDLLVAEAVRFDEHENPTVYPPPVVLDPNLKTFVTLPLTSATATSNTAVFPPLAGSGDAGGWLYLDLNFGTPVHAVAPSERDQAWVIVSMKRGALATDFDATSLGNGCSPVPATTQANNGNGVLGPLPDQTP